MCATHRQSVAADSSRSRSHTHAAAYSSTPRLFEPLAVGLEGSDSRAAAAAVYSGTSHTTCSSTVRGRSTARPAALQMRRAGRRTAGSVDRQAGSDTANRLNCGAARQEHSSQIILSLTHARMVAAGRPPTVNSSRGDHSGTLRCACAHGAALLAGVAAVAVPRRERGQARLRPHRQLHVPAARAQCLAREVDAHAGDAVLVRLELVEGAAGGRGAERGGQRGTKEVTER